MHASAQAPFSTLRKFSHDVLANDAASKPAEKVLNVKLPHGPASCVVVPERTEKPMLAHLPGLSIPWRTIVLRPQMPSFAGMHA